MKYKYNGQWVDVNIKALDSLPIGSEIDFTGSVSDIPTGWEQVSKVGDTISEFSTSEQTIGQSDTTIWNMSNDLSLTGKPLLVIFTVPRRHSGDGSPNYKIYIDNTSKEEFVDSYPNSQSKVTFSAYIPNTLTGTHTIKIVGNSGNASNLVISSYDTKNLTIVEL